MQYLQYGHYFKKSNINLLVSQFSFIEMHFNDVSKPTLGTALVYTVPKKQSTNIHSMVVLYTIPQAC